MSELDVETQLKLQQFSPLVTAMVIDAQTGQSGFFRADAKTKGSIPVPSQNVDAEITTHVPTPNVVEQAMYPQGPTPPSPTPMSIRTILVVVVLITLAVTSGIIALAYYRGPGTYSGNLAITHNPPRPPLTIGNPITVDANVTGSNLANVTLSYKIIQQAPTSQGGVIIGNLIQVPMLPRAAGCTTTCTYSYTLPGSDVSGLYVQYYISAFDTASPPNAVRTDTYTLNVGDFNWHDDTTEVVAIRQVQSNVPLPLDSINGFNNAVTIKIATQAPLGVRIAPANTQVRPTSSANIVITSTDKAQITYKFPIEVDAVYAISNVQVIRSMTLQLTLTDIDIEVSPSYQSFSRCSVTSVCDKTDEHALYTVTLTVYDGFTSPTGIKLYPTGLPDHTTYELLFVDHKIGTDETETLTYYLRIRANTDAKVDKYLFSVVVTAGSITHSVDNIQIEIVD